MKKYLSFASMQIFLGYDHHGHKVRDAILEHLRKAGHDATDLGNKTMDPADDYPDFAYAVGQAVLQHPGSRGFLLCGSGVGVCIAANKIKGIRAGFASNIMQAESSVHDDDANVLCFAVETNHITDILAMMDAYLATNFEGGRHQRRKDKVLAIENGTYKAS